MRRTLGKALLAGGMAFGLAVGVTTVAGASVQTDRWLYAQGDTVQITGDEMLPGEAVVVDVFLPDGSLSQSHAVVADDAGAFSDTYTLASDAPGGIYDVVATGAASGNVFRTQFDPCALSLGNASVDYSDVVAFAGTLGDQGTACSGGLSGRTIDIVVDTDGDGTFVDEAVFASGTTNGTGAFSISSTKIALSPSLVTAQGTGLYKMEAELNGTTVKSSPFSLLTVTKEDTVTSYTGSTSGAANGSLALNATVGDEDSSAFVNDTNLAGTVTFQLYSDSAATTGNEVGTAVTRNLVAGDVQSGSDYLLPATPAAYWMKTSYSGNDYYNGSSDIDEITVTGSSCTFSGILPPVNDVSAYNDSNLSVYKYGSRGVIPAKFQLTCGGDLVDTQAEADTHPMTLGYVKLTSDGTPPGGGDTEAASVGSANTGSAFRFDDTSDQYVFNLAIKGLAQGTYRLTATTGSDTTHEWFGIA